MLLQDLLYKQGRYEEVLNTMEAVMKRQLHGAKHPVDCIILTLAACYQLVRECMENEARNPGLVCVRAYITVVQ